MSKRGRPRNEVNLPALNGTQEVENISGLNVRAVSEFVTVIEQRAKDIAEEIVAVATGTLVPNPGQLQILKVLADKFLSDAATKGGQEGSTGKVLINITMPGSAHTATVVEGEVESVG